MSKVNSLLNERLGKAKTKGPSKMASLAMDSSAGKLTSFAGVFGVGDLSSEEREGLQGLLLKYAEDDQDLEKDLNTLINITAEVKAITHQAALLHGERIKTAQKILKEYKDGAFTEWLIVTYGNRQTPYNFMQYFEFYQAMPKTLRPMVERMPRQAIYTLASREGDMAIKKKIVSDYKGQTKVELLELIREIFPLAEGDKRRQNPGEQMICSLNKLYSQLNQSKKRLTKNQRDSIHSLLDRIRELT